MVSKEEILSIVKTLKGIKDNSLDDILLIFVDMSIQAVLIYCNRDDIPPELKYVIAKMAYESYIDNLIVEQATTYGNVVEVTDGSSTVRYSDSSTASTIIVNKGLIANKTLLDKYKLLYRYPICKK